MVIVVFRTHVKPQADLEKLNALNQKMVALVSKMPGFLAIKDFSAQDGEFLVIAEFDSLKSVTLGRRIRSTSSHNGEGERNSLRIIEFRYAT